MVIRNIVAHYPYALKINYFLFKQNYTILTKSYAIFKFIPWIFILKVEKS